MSAVDGYSNWLEVDLTALDNNIRRLRETVGVQLMAVIKANGYGHGIVEVARIADAAGASASGVARIEEAIELRQAGVRSPLLVLGHTPEDNFRQAVEADVALTIFQEDQARVLTELTRSAGKRASVHVKVDTGMSRLGARPETALHLLRLLGEAPGVQVDGIFTHFARADEPAEPTTEEQEGIFRDVLAEAESAGMRPPLVHAANSAAALSRPSTRFDMVRIGIAMYGMRPSEQVELPSGVGPAMAWKARLTHVTRLPAGTGVSYGHAYRTEGDELIGVIPVGYGDGYRRVPGSYVLVGGKRAPVVGRVCMDQLMVRLDDAQDVHVGDEAVLIGSQGQESILADDLAAHWDTISYEVTCGLGARIPRVYSD